jgi:Xaa-Pro aminopeptidase
MSAPLSADHSSAGPSSSDPASSDRASAGSAPAEPALNHAALRDDVGRRIAAVQRLMAARDVAVLLVVGDGSPNGTAGVRWLSNARAWAGPLHAVLAGADPDPWVLSHSSYQARWTADATTTRPGRVEAPADVIGRVAALAREHAGPGRRVGVAGLPRMALADHARLCALLPGVDLADLTPAFDALRRVKSPFEIAAFRENGALLSQAMEAFAAAARVGVPYASACAQAETVLKANGAFWGRSKVSFGPSPMTVPPAPDRLMAAGDVFTFELVYESPWGYWTEMTTHFAFGGFPDAFRAIFEAWWAAFEAGRALARPGVTQGDIAAAADAALAARGFAPVGKHTPDCHSIGLDGGDGPSAIADPAFTLAVDMVLSLHPGAEIAGGQALLVSDNVRVGPTGGERLSPHDAARRLVVLPSR